jgi:hypothetical protein
MDNKPLSQRLNDKKLFFLLWTAWSVIGLLILSSDVGTVLLSGNLFWDLIIVLGWLASGFPAIGIVVLCFSVIWLALGALKDWLFDK